MLLSSNATVLFILVIVITAVIPLSLISSTHLSLLPHHKAIKCPMPIDKMEPYWDLIKRIIHESDIVLEILDARFLQYSRNEVVEQLIKQEGRPIIFVVNKSDLTSKKILKQEVEKLMQEHPQAGVVFVSIKNKKTIRLLLSVINQMFSLHGKREPDIIKPGEKKLEFRQAKADIVVGVVGYPNVGKSSIINALAHKKKAPVSKKAGTTHGIHWIKASETIKLIDSPGVIPLQKDDEIRYGLIAARDAQNLRNPPVVADALIQLFLKNNKKQFEKYYNITIENEDFDSIIEQIARKRGYLLKGGVADEYRTSILIVQDWQHGKLRL